MAEPSTVAVTPKEASSCPVKVMLQCPDGTFPFLTPSMLKKCFPAEDVSDVMVLGLAVRDVCVAPVFDESSNSRKRKNPRGFSFKPSKVDPWLADYRRIVVPSFDLWEDGFRYAPKKAVEENDEAVLISCCNKYVSLWTNNGRVHLSPSLYMECAQSLGGDSLVTLFDSMAPSGKYTDEVKRRKRSALVFHRTVDFTAACNKSRTSYPRWTPIVVSDGDYLDRNLNLLSSSKRKETGVAVVGWSSVPDSTTRLSTMAKLDVLLQETGQKMLILHINSLVQLLDAVSAKTSIILGTNLPALWASQNRVFMLDWSRLSFSGNRMDLKPVVGEGRDSYDADECLHLQEQDDGPTTHPWFADSGPLLPDCKCWTCMIHSRAYVYHLVCANEMLSGILIFIHNLHRLIELSRLMSRKKLE